MANAGIVTRADFLKAMEPTLNQVFTAGYNLQGEQYSRVWDVRNSKKRTEETFEYVGPSEIAEAQEGAMFQRVTIQSGRSKQFLHITYKAEIKITEEMVEDNMYDQITQAAKSLGIAAKRTVERKSALALANGFGSERTPDNKSAFASDHSVLTPAPGRPSSWSNLMTAAFSSNGVKALRTLMRKTRDENGDISPYYMNQLIVPPDLEWVAGELIESNQNYDNANNAKNVAGRGLEVVVLDHLGEASNYASTMYIGRDKQMAKNIFFWRVRPESKFINEEATGDPIWRARMRFSFGIASPRGIAASTGVV